MYQQYYKVVYIDVINCTSPFQALRSVWQMEVKWILIRTSIF